MDPVKQYKEQSMKTINDLRSIVYSPAEQPSSPEESPSGAESYASRLALSRRSLAIEEMIDQVGQLVPAGNLPGLLLSGLKRLSERRLPQKKVKRDIHMLFKGVEQALDKAVYGALFAGPAAVICAYRNLLHLSGRIETEAFPEGLWQFYVDYAMREDTARHANETIGFEATLAQQGLQLEPSDRATAWVMAAIECLHQYEALLANEWRERVYIQLLAEITRDDPEAAQYARAYRQWEKQRPFQKEQEALPEESYPAYRRRKFEQFLAELTTRLPAERRTEWQQQIQQAEAEALPAYQRQMSILAYLEPDPYQESRLSIPLAEAHVGVIYQGHYYLIPACRPGTPDPPDIHTVRMMISRIFYQSPNSPTDSLIPLAELKRAGCSELRQKFNPSLRQALERLRQAPILINCDRQDRRLTLSELRRTERGTGDHALTLIDTGESMVFDQSHIFFDGAWGAALAEILTQEAGRWAGRLKDNVIFSRQEAEHLFFNFEAAELALMRSAPQVMPEVGAENDKVELKQILRLRQEFQQRSEKIYLTVNDLLLLYRAIHAATYQPEPRLVAELEALARLKTTQAAAEAALEALSQARRVNPAIVMPVDATRFNPRDRLYPITFEVPLNDLKLLESHEGMLAALNHYQQAQGEARDAAYAQFDRLQKDYLERLGAFGFWLGQAKQIASTGQSFSIKNISLILGNLPPALQRLLDKFPEKFDLLNDLIKGREAFSNVGAVAPSSSLTRFISAKDDNEKKSLIWGVLTDAQGVMRISLRDFRPHVGPLLACGQQKLAVRLAQDYLDSYVIGLNGFVRELRRITKQSRETQMERRKPYV